MLHLRKYWFSIFLLTIFIYRYYNCNFCTELKSLKNFPLYSDLEAQIYQVKKEFSISLSKYFTREERALIMGLVIGENELFYLPAFRDALRSTGTIHVVVVSGFNIGLVVNVLVKFLNKNSTFGYVLITLSTFIYSVFTGFQPPIVRAWVMSFLVMSIARSGRNVSSLYVLFVSGLLMLAIEPAYISSLSFQLSFLATFGIIYYDGFIATVFGIKSKHVIAQDFTTTVAAQLFVWPLIAFSFGDVSVLGLVTNPVVLWLIPWATIVGFVYFLLYLLNFTSVLFLVSLVLKVLLQVFVKAIFFFQSWSELNFYYKPTYLFLGIYFVLLLYAPLVLRHFSKK